MPNEICRLVELLARKQELLSELEEETRRLLELPMEQMEASLQDRQVLLDHLSKVELEIEKACENQERLRACVSMQCDMSALSEKEKKLMDALIEVHARSNRITKLDRLVLKRMETKRDAIREKLERLNTSGAAAAEKYYQSAVRTHSFYGAAGRQKKI